MPSALWVFRYQHHYHHSWTATRLILSRVQLKQSRAGRPSASKKVALQKLCNSQVSHVVIEQSISLHIFSRRDPQKCSMMTAVQRLWGISILSRPIWHWWLMYRCQLPPPAPRPPVQLQPDCPDAQRPSGLKREALHLERCNVWKKTLSVKF